MYHDEKYCKNCGQHLILNQRFCHNCGQKADTHRINFHFLVHEVQHAILHVDKGFLYTLKELFTRPGHTIREYIQGRRQSHFKPVLLIMILGTISFLFNKILYSDNNLLFNTSEVKELQNSEEFKKEMDGSKGALLVKKIIDFFQKALEWINEHFALSVLLMIPLFAFSMYFAYFTRKKERRLNFSEFLVIAAFLSAQTMSIYILSIPFKDFFNITWIFLLIMLAVNFWTMVQFYENKRIFKVILRFVSSYILLGIILFLLIILLLIFTIISSKNEFV